MGFEEEGVSHVEEEDTLQISTAEVRFNPLR